MRVKSYFASTVEAAIAMASREMGDEAMLVYSREATPETKYLGRYEVVFALAGGDPEEPPAPPPLADGSVADARGSVAAATSAITEPRRDRKTTVSVEGPADIPSAAILAPLREDIRALRQCVERLATTGAGPQPCPPLLANSGLKTPLPAALLDAALAGESQLLAHLMESIKTDSRLGRSAGSARVLVLVGLSGSGKTSALVKLAAHYAKQSRRLPHLVSLDSQRIGSRAELQTYAELLGTTFQQADEPEQFARAVEVYQEKDLVLVDTTAYSLVNDCALERLRGFLIAVSRSELLITLSASMKAADGRRAVERIRDLAPSRLLFTHLDETGSFGPAWAEASRTGLAVSYLSTGPAIPEDLREARAETLAQLVVNPEQGWTQLLAGAPQTSAAAASAGLIRTAARLPAGDRSGEKGI